MAGLLSEYVSKYVRQISDGTPPKAEYVRHFEARSPRVLGGQALVQAFDHIKAKHSTEIEPFVDLEVQYAIGDVVSSLVLADAHVDRMSNKDVGVDVHNVPADGDCMLHAFIKATENLKNNPYYGS